MTFIQAVVGEYLYPLTVAEVAASVTPSSLAYPPGHLLRYGADPLGVADSQAALQRALSTGQPAYIPEGTFKFLSAATYTGKVSIRGEGSKTTLRCDGSLLTVTSGSHSVVDNLTLENITAPWIITRNPANWSANPAGTLQQSNADGYQPTVNDNADYGNGSFYDTLTTEQKTQNIGPTIVFTGNASNIEVSRIYGRFVRIDMLDTVYSSVHHCDIRGGKGVWGAINFDNATNGLQSGVGNSASSNVVRFASFNGIIFQNNDGPIAYGNRCESCGESGIKPAGGGNRKCSRALVVANRCIENLYDGIDLVTSFPTNTTIEASHKAIGNYCYRNGGDGINVDGKYNQVIDNIFERNGRFGIWCTGANATIQGNRLIDNNQERNPSFPEILGGGADGCYIVGNLIHLGAGANSAAIYYDKKGYIANNWAQGGKFFFGTKPNSRLENNRDDNGLQH